jgi:hypothetical protein
MPRSATFNGRKGVDYASLEANNRRVGQQGELLVLEREKKKLLDSGHRKLANRVRHISVEVGDGAGFDILSFTTSGQEKFIEVKATRGGERSPFYLSRRELEFSQANPHQYYLVRVYELSLDGQSGSSWTQKGPPDESFLITPTEYRVRP